MNFKDLMAVSLILFSVIDIIGSIPILISMKKKGVEIESGKAAIVAFILMTIFLYTGASILHLFGVDIESFAVAGAIIIFLMGLEMILGIRIFHEDPDTSKGTVVPVAFPLIAGAGSMTTILSLKAKYEAIDIQMGILINIIFVYLVLKSSGWLGKKLGTGGAMILRKVFGIILLAIAIKLFKENFILMAKG